MEILFQLWDEMKNLKAQVLQKVIFEVTSVSSFLWATAKINYLIFHDDVGIQSPK